MDSIVPFISKVSSPASTIVDIANRLMCRLEEMRSNVEKATILQEFLSLCVNFMVDVDSCPEQDKERLQPYLTPLLQALEKAEKLLTSVQSTRCRFWMFACFMNRWVKWVQRFVFSPAWNRQIKEIHQSLNNIQTALGAQGVLQNVELREEMTKKFQNIKGQLDLASKEEIEKHRKKVSKAKQTLKEKDQLIFSYEKKVSELQGQVVAKDERIQGLQKELSGKSSHLKRTEREFSQMEEKIRKLSDLKEAARAEFEGELKRKEKTIELLGDYLSDQQTTKQELSEAKQALQKNAQELEQKEGELKETLVRLSAAEKNKTFAIEGKDDEIQTLQGKLSEQAEANENLSTLLENIRRICTQIFKTTKDSEAPFLFKAVEKNDLQTVEAFVAIGFDLHVRDDAKMTPLHIAARGGHLLIVTSLLSAGADANVQSESGLTALHLASQNGHVKVVKALVDFGADVDSRNEVGWTPLHLASFRGKLDVAETLLDIGANKYLIDDDERRPGDVLCEWSSRCSTATRDDLTKLLN